MPDEKTISLSFPSDCGTTSLKAGAKKSIVVVSLSNSSDRRRSPAGRGMVKARQVKDDIENRTKASQHIGGHYFSLSLLSLVPLLWSTEQLACMQVDLANR